MLHSRGGQLDGLRQPHLGGNVGDSHRVSVESNVWQQHCVLSE
jgi:hypothetical protein